MLRFPRTPMAVVRFAAAAALFAAAAIVPSCARAQTGVYVLFSGQRYTANSDWMWGPTFGLYHDQHSFAPLHLGLDFRGYYLTQGGNTMVGGLGGARASIVPHVIPIKIYGEGLGGVGVVDVNSTHFTRFQWQLDAGLEYTILPRIDWRVIEGTYGGFVGSTGQVGNPAGLSTGLVFRLP